MTTRECIICGRVFVPVREAVRCCSHACAGASRANRREDLWRYVDVGAADECWPWQRWLDRDGYGTFTCQGRSHKAHRFAFELGHGVSPGVLKVCHSCDNPPCCNPAHLFLGTQAQNLEDMRAKDRHARGERSANAVITEDQVRAIRRRRGAGERGRALAAEFGISEATVCNVFKRATWRHVA